MPAATEFKSILTSLAGVYANKWDLMADNTTFPNGSASIYANVVWVSTNFAPVRANAKVSTINFCIINIKNGLKLFPYIPY